MKTRVLLIALPMLAALTMAADTVYQKPPKAILDVFNAPDPPQVLVSPAKDYLLLIESAKYPTIAELAQPMLRIAGLRINPNTNGPHRSGQRGGAVRSLTLLKIADGSEARIALPSNAQLTVNTGGGRGRSASSWSSDGKYVAFTNTIPKSIELWVLDVAMRKATKIEGVTISAAYGTPVQWMPDQRTLLVQTIPAGRGPAPVERVPRGPSIQENVAKKAPVWTFEDLLKNPHDEALFT